MNGENFPSNSETSSESQNSSYNEWQQKMSEVPPFGSHQEKPAEQSAENSKERVDALESDDYTNMRGIEYRNIDKIDISTDQGKYEWLDSILENGAKSQRAEVERLESEGFDDSDDEMVEARARLRSTERQQKILRDQIDINGDGGMFENLRKRRVEMFNRWNNMGEQATQQAVDIASENYYAIKNMEYLLESEMARRDPNYFGAEEIMQELQVNVREAERNVDKTMVDGYFGEDGFIHKSAQGEKLRTAATDDTEIDLKYAKQEAETFSEIFNSYNASIDYQTPRAVKKADSSPKITEYIDGHTAELDRLLNESRNLDKNSQEYTANKANRKKLAAERSAARRLMSKYFTTPELSVNNSNNETNTKEVPLNESEERIESEAPVEERTQEEPTSYHFEGGIVDGEATVTVGQEIPNEWFSPRIYGEGTPVIVNRDPLITDYLTQALNTEFSKLSEDERKNINYAEISKAIADEAQRTRKFPDIATFLKRNNPDVRDDGMRMEEMPAGKSREEIEAEAAKKAREDAEYQARVDAYWAEKRAAEQKQREEQERIQKEREQAEAERQRILKEQRERIMHQYNRGQENGGQGEEQEDEMEMGM